MTGYYKMRQILLQNATDIGTKCDTTPILLQNATDVYHKMRQVFYYKIRQFYYKMRHLKNATFITYCDSTYFEYVVCGRFIFDFV